jgi:hypothetical protein
VKALALKKGRKTIEVSRRGAAHLWSIAASHYSGKVYWAIGCLPAAEKSRMQADGWRVVPVEVKEVV